VGKLIKVVRKSHQSKRLLHLDHHLPQDQVEVEVKIPHLLQGVVVEVRIHPLLLLPTVTMMKSGVVMMERTVGMLPKIRMFFVQLSQVQVESLPRQLVLRPVTWSVVPIVTMMNHGRVTTERAVRMWPKIPLIFVAVPKEVANLPLMPALHLVTRNAL
jgi:hypothetical protein